MTEVNEIIENLENKEPVVAKPVLKVSLEEMTKVKEARVKAIQATAAAEKAFNIAQIADLESRNIILSIFNKYKLSMENGDNVMEDGTVIYGKGEKSNE